MHLTVLSVSKKPSKSGTLVVNFNGPIIEQKENHYLRQQKENHHAMLFLLYLL